MAALCRSIFLSAQQSWIKSTLYPRQKAPCLYDISMKRVICVKRGYSFIYIYYIYMFRGLEFTYAVCCTQALVISPAQRTLVIFFCCKKLCREVSLNPSYCDMERSVWKMCVREDIYFRVSNSLTQDFIINISLSISLAKSSTS